MSRALIRLRPDGIHEIVSPLPARKRAFALSVLLVASTFCLVVAAAFSAFLRTAHALLAGAAIASLALLVALVRFRLRSAARPLAVTIPLRRAAPVDLARATRAGDAGGIGDGGAARRPEAALSSPGTAAPGGG